MPTPLRVLILEDNPADAELVMHSLRRAGYEPSGECVETEDEYRAQLQLVPEIILADFSMPEFDALRALEIMKEYQFDIPFIVVSGSIGEERAVRIVQHGATDYIVKDRLGRLGQAVAYALETRHLRHETRLAERRLDTQHATTKVLAESANLEVAIPQIIEAVCKSMGWVWAGVWMIDAEGKNLELAHSWHSPSANLGEFVTICRDNDYPCGNGLLGGVWACRQTGVGVECGGDVGP